MTIDEIRVQVTLNSSDLQHLFNAMYYHHTKGAANTKRDKESDKASKYWANEKEVIELLVCLGGLLGRTDVRESFYREVGAIVEMRRIESEV